MENNIYYAQAHEVKTIPSAPVMSNAMYADTTIHYPHNPSNPSNPSHPHASAPSAPFEPSEPSAPIDLTGHNAFQNQQLLAVKNPIGLDQLLSTKKVPKGMREFFINDINKAPKRFFVCDDSGSMMATDGNIMNEQTNRYIKCSRWQEQLETIKYQIDVSNAGNIDTTFMFLNRAPIIAGQNAFVDYNQCPQLNSAPNGGTPLCKILRQIINEIKPEAEMYRRQNKMFMIVISTDGESSDGNVASVLMELQHYPVCVTLRLCTDDDKIVNYWNNVDNDLEISLDVLDDYVSEAKEVYECNPWLTYGIQLHRMREFGLVSKEIDLIDEKKIRGTEIWSYVNIIYGHADHNMHEDIKKTITTLNKNAPCRIFNPMTNSHESWIIPKYMDGKCGCVIM
jgi:hypothetical protein